MIAALSLALMLQAPVDPVTIGRADLAAAMREKKLANSLLSASTRIDASLGPERYRIDSDGRTVRIQGGDAVGLMYGQFELAERIRNADRKVPKFVVTGKPYLAERGWNMFLPLPWDYEKNFVDNDPAALTDPNRWFFHNEDYWRTLFAQMAKSRLNWLDIHGPYDLDTTRFPNLYAYFIHSNKFPEVGVSKEIKAKNLQQLAWIIRLAHQHGIKVSLMSYEARFDTPHNPRPPYKGDEAEVYEYTQEVVEKMIRYLPELDKIGFRIGESGRGGEFFQCYLDAVKASGRDIPLYTRSWITRKSKVVPLAKASKDFTVEIKYNGEHWGAPYILAGGRSANWYSYFYEDYLSYSGSDGAVKMWPGVPIDDFRLTIDDSGSGASQPNRQLSINNRQSSWPSQPYKLIWQVRANGTHRIFPFYNPEWTRRSILSMKMGTTTGYTVESLASYFPQEPRFYWTGDPLPYKWIHQRDEMYMASWGRLGYDPNTPDWKFDQMIIRKFGGLRGFLLAHAWEVALKGFMTWFMAFSIGPDHRSHAPELEWGGDVKTWATTPPFDTHVFRSTQETEAYRHSNGIDGRISPKELSSYLLFEGMDGRTWPRDDAVLKDSRELNIEQRIEIDGGIGVLESITGYFVYKMMAALSYLKYESTGLVDFHTATVSNLAAALSHYQYVKLYGPHEYRPVTDRLRMHTHNFKWQSEYDKAEKELRNLKPGFGELHELFSGGDQIVELNPPPNIAEPRLTLSESEVILRLPASDPKQPWLCMDRAWLLEKPLPSSTFFHKTRMARVGEEFVGKLQRSPWGHAVAVEIEFREEPQYPPRRRRVPWWQTDRPYLVVPAQEKPTPPIYSSEEAMTYLDPEVLQVVRHGALLLGTRAWNFHRRFDKSTQRKLLYAVERGLDLVIMQQDFASGRYPLDWLPTKPTIVNRPTTIFDPAGALGMEKIETADILWQPIEPGSGWEVHGNGGVASLKHGKGTIWIVQARIVQRMHIPAAARSLKALLKSCNFIGPVVLVDAATENGDSADSIIPDFMNAHEIPFLTLGEVIAQEQGMDSLTPIPGPIAADDILKGQGKDMANRWLKNQVIQASKRETPKDLPSFELERTRRKKILLQSLGLDPAPPKTPLNARITGEIQRPGYRIQKLVYESRPKFYVTAHVYLPDPLPLDKLPVVVNVNGHWAHKKNEDRIQLRAAFQALQGYLALAIDSPGWSFEGNSPIERRPEGNHNDWKLFLGTNATGIYVWDVIRGLDYLETRNDVDMSRIGITGASGGGLATLYAFAAEDRFSAAASVVYMSSMELAPDNGCLCNHVPGTSQIGDRSDIAAIQAPKPFLIMGAENDPEFPPDAMRLTGKKMTDSWNLFGRPENVQILIFPGGHDYSQPMREASLGFFNKHLKGTGDGSPVLQPSIQAIPSDDRSLLALDPPANDERTMRDLVREMLESARRPASKESLVQSNGGIPFKQGTLHESGTGAKRTFTLETDGLTAPGVLTNAASSSGSRRIYLDDRGKAALWADHETQNDPNSKQSRVYFDPIGIGELAGIEMRYLMYLGQSAAFVAANQVVALAKELRKNGNPVEIQAFGKYSQLVLMYARILNSTLVPVEPIEPPARTWSDFFDDRYPNHAVQPRAHLVGSLESLMQLAKSVSPSQPVPDRAR